MTSGSVLVVGAGAIGGVIAAALTDHGHPVQVLDANAEHVARLRHPGLVTDRLGTITTTPIDAVTDADDLGGRFATAVVTVKAPQLAAALAPLAERGLVDTYLSLGNGLVQDRVGGIVGADRLLAGVVEWGATNHGAGHVAQTTTGPFVIGEPDGTTSDRLHAVGELLGDVSDVRTTADIRGQIWSKLLVNSAMSGLGAVTGLRYGQLADHPHGRRALYGLWREGWAAPPRACVWTPSWASTPTTSPSDPATRSKQPTGHWPPPWPSPRPPRRPCCRTWNAASPPRST